MSKLDVSLINTGKDDVSVGVGSTLLVAKAGEITEAKLDDMSGDAYGMLVGGVALVPAGTSLDDLCAMRQDAAPKPAAKRRRASAKS